VADRKIYETIFQLGAKVQASLGKGFGAVQQNMRAVQQQAKQTEQSTKSFSGALKWAGGIAAGYFSVNAVMDYANRSAEAAKASISAETRLATVMRQRMKATDAQIASITQLAAAQQRLGVVEDDTQIAGGQQLATYLKQAKSLQVLLPAMNDLLAQQKGVNATSTDSVNIANMMGKVFTGQIGALRRVGISFSAAEERVLKYGNEQTKAAMLAKIITNNVGKMNFALAQTDEGKLTKARNMLGDMQEEIGKKIIPAQVKMAEMQLKFIPYVEKVLPLLDKIPPLIEKGANAVDFVIRNWGKIAPVIEAVTVALVANKVATLGVVAAQKAGLIIQTLIKAWQTGAAVIALMREGYSLWTIAQMQLNVAMAANPIGVVIAAVTALGIGVYYLIKNWDKVKKFFSGLWTWLKDNWKTILSVVFMPWIGIPMLIIKNWNKIKGIFGGGGKKKGDTPQVPQYARGTSYHPGGLAIAGERGRELLNLPRGSRVTPNNRTEQLLKGLGGGSAAISYAPQFIIQGNADERVLREANDQAQADFERRMDAYFNKKRRLSFA
jgi:hypothetical protein